MFIQYLKTFINSTYSIFKTFILILILLDNITAPKQLKESVREMISSSTKQKDKNYLNNHYFLFN